MHQVFGQSRTGLGNRKYSSAGIKDNAVSAVSDSRRLLAKINDDVLKNAISNEKFEVVTTLYRQLAELEATEIATDA